MAATAESAQERIWESRWAQCIKVAFVYRRGAGARTLAWCFFMTGNLLVVQSRRVFFSSFFFETPRAFHLEEVEEVIYKSSACFPWQGGCWWRGQGRGYGRGLLQACWEMELGAGSWDSGGDSGGGSGGGGQQPKQRQREGLTFPSWPPCQRAAPFRGSSQGLAEH